MNTDHPGLVDFNSHYNLQETRQQQRLLAIQLH
jgi:hypothetical protein